MHRTVCLASLIVCAALLLPALARGADWAQVQKLKANYVTLTAQHAMEQQRTAAAAPVAVAWPEDLPLTGNVKIARRATGELALEITAAPKVWNAAPAETLRIKLAKPLDLVTQHSGLAFAVKTAEGTSPEVRIGCRLLGTNGKVAVIDPIVPVLDAFGANPHEVYLDWAFLNYASADDAVAILKSVEVIELTFGAAVRAPQRGASAIARPATFTLSDLRVVNYLTGSYDASRQWLEWDTKAEKWIPSQKRDLTLQHRTQEVTGIVARFGGEAGVKSALASLDHLVRTQCWDGSFLDGRRGPVTVASGEYTFGFTIYGALGGYLALEKAKNPALDEKMTVGPTTLTRREFYQRMFYHAALARTAALPSDYRDDIIGGDTLMAGANRVLGYAIAMRMVADALTDPAQKKEVLEKFDPIMQQIADAQGKYSGGFPILGEGDRYNGKGIHYDVGYTRTHMDWLIVGAVCTGDPRLIQMLNRFQKVFEAVMDEEGDGMAPLLSERHPSTESVQLILPDATAQVGLKYKLPIIAQWGYNCGIPVWTNWEKKPGNHFSYASRARGYPLGAHMSILVDDMAVEPEPKDLGYLFPRQFPIWSARLMTKEGKVARTSRMYIRPDGTRDSDFVIQIGEYPETVGVPVLVKSPEGSVTATALFLSGWPKLLPADAEITVSGDVTARGKIGQALKFKLEKETRFVVSGPASPLPPEAGEAGPVQFKAEFTLAPDKPGQTVEWTILNGTVPQPLKFIPPAAAGK